MEMKNMKMKDMMDSMEMGMKNMKMKMKDMQMKMKGMKCPCGSGEMAADCCMA